MYFNSFNKFRLDFLIEEEFSEMS